MKKMLTGLAVAMAVASPAFADSDKLVEACEMVHFHADHAQPVASFDRFQRRVVLHSVATDPEMPLDCEFRSENDQVPELIKITVPALTLTGADLDDWNKLIWQHFTK